MKLLLTSSFVCLIASQQYVHAQPNLEKYLGTDRADALNKMVASFDTFLKTHANQTHSIDEYTRSFLDVIEVTGPSLHSTMNIDSLEALSLLQNFEDTGLRKDIWLFQSEEYPDEDVIVFYKNVKDSLLLTGNFDTTFVDLGNIEDDFDDILNVEGFKEPEEKKDKDPDKIREVSQYSRVYAILYRNVNQNNFVKDFCEDAIFYQGIRSPEMLARQMRLSKDIDLTNHYVKIIMVMEIYYHILYERVYNETAPNTG